MTTVEYSNRGGMFRLKADGHAGWEGTEPGRDLVCAAESMLAYTLLQSLQDARERGWIQELDTDIWDGGVLAEAVPAPDGMVRVATIYHTVLTGYRMLSRRYPHNVEVLVDR